MADCYSVGYCRSSNKDADGSSVPRSFAYAAQSWVGSEYGGALVTVSMLPEGNILVPSFSGSAWTVGPGFRWASASATAVEAYRHTGNARKAYSFTASFAAQTTSLRTWDVISADFYLFKSEGFEYLTHLPTLLGETDAVAITNVSFGLATNVPVNATRTVEVEVDPGEVFYLFAQLRVNNFQDGGSTETIQPFTISCANPSGLESESLTGAIPLSIRPEGTNVHVSWPPTRRVCQLESASESSVPVWKSVEDEVRSDANGGGVLVSTVERARIFRLRLD